MVPTHPLSEVCQMVSDRASSPEATLEKPQPHGLRMARMVLSFLYERGCELLRTVQAWLYIRRAAFRSCRGHIQIQSARERVAVRLGPTLERSRTGHLQPNVRTLCRGEGIRNLLATYQWADNADLRVFLLGFDLGEQFGRSCPDTDQLQTNLGSDRS